MFEEGLTIINVLEDAEFGYSDQSPLEILQHLTTTYATISIDDLEDNRSRLSADWNPDDPIENLWTLVKSVTDYAAASAEPTITASSYA